MYRKLEKFAPIGTLFVLVMVTVLLVATCAPKPEYQEMGVSHYTSDAQFGVDGTGVDLTFYSDTAGDYGMWDTSEEAFIIVGTAGQDALDVNDGNVDIADDVDIDGTLNADNIDIDGTTNFADTVTFAKGSGDAAVISAGGTLSLPATADISAYGYVAVGDGTPDGSVSAGTDEALYVEGAFECDAEAEFDGAIDADSTSNFAGTATFAKGSGDAVVIAAGGTLSMPATADLAAYGYVAIGDGTPDGSVSAGTDEALYVEGAFECDAEAEFDGAIDADSTSNFAGTATFAKGSGDAVVIGAGGTLSMPATADIAAYGYVAVGDGTPDGSVSAGTDEALYVEGAFECDAEAEFDGAIDADSTSNFAGTATFAKGSGDAVVIAAGGTLSMPATADLSAYGYVAVGDGTPDGSVTAGTDESCYVEGAFEVDGASDLAGTATFSKGSGDAVVIAAGGTLSMPATADISAYGYVAVGDGTPDGTVTAGTDESLYVEGPLEVDGAFIYGTDALTPFAFDGTNQYEIYFGNSDSVTQTIVTSATHNMTTAVDWGDCFVSDPDADGGDPAYCTISISGTTITFQALDDDGDNATTAATKLYYFIIGR